MINNNISLRTSDIAINYIFFLKYHVQKEQLLLNKRKPKMSVSCDHE